MFSLPVLRGSSKFNGQWFNGERVKGVKGYYSVYIAQVYVKNRHFKEYGVLNWTLLALGKGERM